MSIFIDLFEFLYLGEFLEILLLAWFCTRNVELNYRCEDIYKSMQTDANVLSCSLEMKVVLY